jgi:hypothetical protein
MFERFTDRARRVNSLANNEAQMYNYEFVEPEHVLLGLIKEGSGVGANTLKNLDVELGELRKTIEKRIGQGDCTLQYGKRGNSQRTNELVARAIEEARALNHPYVGTEHLLLALASDADPAVRKIFEEQNLSYEKVRGEIVSLLCPAKEPTEIIDAPQNIKEIIRSVRKGKSGLETQIEFSGITSGISSAPPGTYDFLAEYSRGQYVLSAMRGVKSEDGQLLASILETSHQRGALVKLSGTLRKGHGNKAEELLLTVKSVQLGDYKIETQ